MIKRIPTGLLALTLIILTWTYASFAQHDAKIVDGLKVTFAITTVKEIKKSHPYPEIKMHGGPKGTHHLLIHIEDEDTGKTVSNASVSVNVHNPDGTMVGRALEPMSAAGRTDFGNYFELSGAGDYHIEVFVTPEKGEAKRVLFVYKKRLGL